MNTTGHNQLAVHECAEAHREIIARKLDQIAAEVSDALRDAALSFSIFLAVPSSGNSLVSFAATADPADADWTRAGDIVCGILSEVLGLANLSSRPLRCAVANAGIEVAEVFHPDSGASGTPVVFHEPQPDCAVATP